MHRRALFPAVSTLPALAALAFAAPAAAQDPAPLLDAERAALLHEALSGELAKDHVIQITRHHRIQGSRGYRRSAEYVLDQLRGYGFGEADARIESFPSDGRIAYQTWQSPSGWDIESAELRMVEPYEARIVGYPEIAMSLITYSNPGDVTAELVWVGRGTSDADYEDIDVTGKWVLATGYGGSVHRLAVLEYGAAGVVAYLDDDRAAEHPDMLQYTGMWPRSEELERVTFGFNLTNRQGEKLRLLLASGERVVVHGTARGIGLEPYFMDVVVARIPGTDRAADELYFSAHLDHPKESANDNASGSAAILDIARAVRELIDSGRMEGPRRTLVFLWVPEWYGTMAYIDAHPEMVGPRLGGRALANVNMDMVGENQALLHSRMIFTRTPASLPSAVNDVVENMAQMVARMDVRTPRGSLGQFGYQVTPYSGGSDHMMFIDRGVPGIMFGHSPDYTHHTSEDTPDKVDPVELERSELVAAATMLYLSDLTDAEAADLARLVSANAAQRLGLAAREAARLTGEGGDAAADAAANLLESNTAWEIAALASVLWFADGAEADGAVTAGLERISHDAAANFLAAGAPGSTTPADTRVPVRTTRGPLAFDLPESRLSAEDRAWYSSADFPFSGAARFELVNFVDGERNVSVITDLLGAEFGRVSQEAVGRYLDDLASIGVMAWK